jgi:hypothetical protein
MIQLDRSSCPAPPLLEQLGALCSLLAHDLANQLCVISGSTSFAQMVSNDPHRITTALDAIARASETAGHAVSSFGEYRRTLPAAFLPVPAREVVAVLTAYAKQAGWRCIMPPTVEGSVLLPPQWVVFAASGIRTEIGSKPVVLRVNRYSPSNDGVRISEAAVTHHDAKLRPGLRIRFGYPSKEPFSIKEVRTRYENLGLLAAFELNRMLGGELDSHTSSCGHQEIDLLLPFEG